MNLPVTAYQTDASPASVLAALPSIPSAIINYLNQSQQNARRNGVTLVNQSSSAQTIKLAYKNFNAGNKFYWYTLTGGTDNGNFSRKVYVNGQGTSLPGGGPLNYAAVKAYSANAANGVYITLPPMSVVFMAVEKL
ncbi:hypothetical protein [Parafilimonas sp.]|uniref:hypothetical protein n=1 Tax=Parafilimonas sp. TaxID=1969739 RepID=UPI0039E394A9